MSAVREKRGDEEHELANKATCSKHTCDVPRSMAREGPWPRHDVTQGGIMGKGLILWLLGVPVSVILLLWFLGFLH